MRRLLIALSLFVTGCGTPSLLITPVANSYKLEEISVDEGKGWATSKVAIIELEGLLMNAKTGGLLQPTENKLSLFTEQMQRAEQDPSVKAVVLRINSPGGTVTCSDSMYEIVKEFRAKTKKPVISSCQEVCASGAYYVACGTDVIMANPTSVVGSIGVIMNTLDLSGTMAKLGIRSEAIVSGPMKDMGSPFKPLDPQARAVMQGMIDDYYKRFVGVVTSNRNKLTAPDQLKTATDGRVFSGEQAVAMHLADRTGRLEDAIDLAREMSKSPGARVIMYKRPYGYTGSVYADANTPQPQANVFLVNLPENDIFLPRGFYYLWQP